MALLHFLDLIWNASSGWCADILRSWSDGQAPEPKSRYAWLSQQAFCHVALCQPAPPWVQKSLVALQKFSVLCCLQIPTDAKISSAAKMVFCFYRKSRLDRYYFRCNSGVPHQKVSFCKYMHICQRSACLPCTIVFTVWCSTVKFTVE